MSEYEAFIARELGKILRGASPRGRLSHPGRQSVADLTPAPRRTPAKRPAPQWQDGPDEPPPLDTVC